MRRPGGSRRRGAAAAATAVVLALGGVGTVALGSGASLGASADPARGGAGGTAGPEGGSTAPVAAVGPGRDRAPVAQTAPGEADLGATLPRSEPVGLSIPAIGVRRESLVHLGRLPDGRLEVPADFAEVGWYTAGPAPGQFGPAVLAGHVDSRSGPAVFHRLAELAAGDVVEVSRADGTVAAFTIDRVERHPKDEFPTVAVYGNTTDRAELRLITCGGQFDRSSGHYRDNIVVFAHLTAAT